MYQIKYCYLTVVIIRCTQAASAAKSGSFAFLKEKVAEFKKNSLGKFTIQQFDKRFVVLLFVLLFFMLARHTFNCRDLRFPLPNLSQHELLKRV